MPLAMASASVTSSVSERSSKKPRSCVTVTVKASVTSHTRSSRSVRASALFYAASISNCFFRPAKCTLRPVIVHRTSISAALCGRHAGRRKLHCGLRQRLAERDGCRLDQPAAGRTGGKSAANLERRLVRPKFPAGSTCNLLTGMQFLNFRGLRYRERPDDFVDPALKRGGFSDDWQQRCVGR